MVVQQGAVGWRGWEAGGGGGGGGLEGGQLQDVGRLSAVLEQDFRGGIGGKKENNRPGVLRAMCSGSRECVLQLEGECAALR